MLMNLLIYTYTRIYTYIYTYINTNFEKFPLYFSSQSMISSSVVGEIALYTN